MTANIIHDPSFPHGDRSGYGLGCRGAHCPADVACRDVHRRYISDWAYRKQIDSGMNAVQIAQAEQEAVEAALNARKAATRTAATLRHNEARRKARTTTTRAAQSPHTATIIRLHTDGLLDAEIGRHIGLGRRQVTTLRDGLGLKPNRSINTDTIRELHAAGMTDTEIAAHLNQQRARQANRRAVAAVRLRLGLAPNPAPVNATGAFLSHQEVKK